MKRLLLATVIALMPGVAMAGSLTPMPVYHTDNSPEETGYWQTANQDWGNLTEEQRKTCIAIPPGGAEPNSYMGLDECVETASGANEVKAMQSQASSPTPATAPVATTPADIEETDQSVVSPDCSDPGTPQLFTSILSGGTGLIKFKVISVDKITAEKTTSGRQLCQIKAFTDHGEQHFLFQYFAHSGQLYGDAQLDFAADTGL